MFIQKLPWAGIRVEYEGVALAIDPLHHFPTKFGQPNEALPPLSTFGPVDAVLITHLHQDHFDPEAIAAFYGSDIPVYVPAEAAREAATAGPLTRVQGVSLGERIQAGPFTVTAGRAVDGIGDPQVSWVVDAGGRKLLHSGDTLWHGYWWSLAEAYGPFDAVFLPVNGAVIQLPGRTPSGQPITLLPEQAVSAASVLGAAVLVPIHYGLIHNPPNYVQTPDLLKRLTASAETHGVRLAILQTGETLALAGVN